MFTFLNACRTLLNPVLQPPAPTGPFLVGFAEATLTDSSLTTRTGPREIALEAWYPARSTEGMRPEPYSTPAHNAVLHKYQGVPRFLLSVRPSHSYRDAPPLGKRHPTVLFHHGYPSYGRQNFSQMQELASHGYLVVAIGHPGESLTAQGVSGNFVELDANSTAYKGFQAAQRDATNLTRLAHQLERQREAKTLAQHDEASLELAATRQFASCQEVLEDWLGDTRFVIRELSARDPKGFLGLADPEKIALMGHSFGGSLALELGRNPPEGVRGIINLDGSWLRYPNRSQKSLQVPALLVLSTQNRFSGHDLGLHGTFGIPAGTSSRSTYVMEIAGTGHFNFTDLNYLPILKLFSPLLGQVDNACLGTRLNQVLVEFLNRVNGPNPAADEIPLLSQANVHQLYFPGASANSPTE